LFTVPCSGQTRWPSPDSGSDGIPAEIPCLDPPYTIELEREADGRWIAEVPDLAGVLSYGANREQAVKRVQALALRVIAERLENDEAPPDLPNVTFNAA
jgi:predicted RNase H-like HicB family nuclease